MSSEKSRGPVLIEIDTDELPRPEDAHPVPDLADRGDDTAMQHVVALAGRKPSRLARWFWGTAVSLTGFVVSLAAWDYLNTLVARSPILGGIAVGLSALVILILLIVSLRELAALARLRRVDRVQSAVQVAREGGSLEAARMVVDRLTDLYRSREDTAWGRARLAETAGEQLDVDGLLALTERSLLEPLDTRAVREIEAASRQVATVTALVPLALADVLVALTANLRMIRRISEIYGGRSGVFGSWRLTRAVLTHLVATGAVAVGDDLIGAIAGGGVLAKVSRRFGEGVINGALTARVGVAAIEVCRPMPFDAVKRPSVTALVKRALVGLFTR